MTAACYCGIEVYAHEPDCTGPGARADALTCPICDSHDLAVPYDNGYIPDATFCRDCGARMTADAATPGSDAHAFITRNR